MDAIILAGGGGTRLWPLSRPETPKPFLPLLDERSLLQRTVDRLAGHPELAIALEDVTVVTDRRYATLVRQQLPGVRVVVEPMGRNTAAAIALAVVSLDRDVDDVMLVLPADHTIEREAAFRSALATAARLAEGAFGIEAPLVTIGIQHDRPATEYGYLLPELERGETVGGLRAYPLQGFEEKPSRERAAQLVAEAGVAWNAGIFAWRRSAIREAIGRYTGILTLLEPVASSDTGLAAAYDQVRSVSIDHAVMESAARDRRVAMATMDVGWSDLGSWTALLAALGAVGTGRVVPAGEAVAAGAADLVVERRDGRLVVGSGPRDILATGPVALLAGAAPSRRIVEALVDRVAAWEERA